MPKEAPAFLKATDPVCGLVKRVKDNWMSKETRYWNFKWWLMEEEEDPVQEAMTRSLNKARKTYQEYFQDIQDQEVQDVDGQKPFSNHGFGRGFASGRGQPVPSRWFLLGGSRSMVGFGKTTRRKAGPTSKGSCGGKLTLIYYIFPSKDYEKCCFLKRSIAYGIAISRKILKVNN